MKQMSTILAAVVLGLSAFSPTAHALGEGVAVFETSGQGGLWDHGDSIYLRFSTKRHADVWAGLSRVAGGDFRGEVVIDQFGPREQRTAATATVMAATGRKLIELTFTLPGDSEPTRVLLDKTK